MYSQSINVTISTEGALINIFLLSYLRLDEDLIKVKLIHPPTGLSSGKLPLSINFLVIVLHERQSLTRSLDFFLLKRFVSLVFSPNLEDKSANLRFGAMAMVGAPRGLKQMKDEHTW